MPPADSTLAPMLPLPPANFLPVYCECEAKGPIMAPALGPSHIWHTKSFEITKCSVSLHICPCKNILTFSL